MTERKKTAKDMAFEKERNHLKREIREMEMVVKRKDAEIVRLREEKNIMEKNIRELEDWNRRLLEYMDLSEEEMRNLIQKEKNALSAAKMFGGVWNLMDKCYGGRKLPGM